MPNVSFYYRKKAVEIHAGELINGLEQRDLQLALQTQSGKTILADAAVAGLGLLPNHDPLAPRI